MVELDKMIFEELSAVERKVIILIRSLRPYDRLEIKLNKDLPGEVSITQTSTVKEIFPVDMG